MPEPLFTRHPVEYFGHTFADIGAVATADRAAQRCPFLDSECKKPRKSEPAVKIGICTVGYKPKFLEKALPVVICPYRYHVKTLFDQIAERYLPPPDATSYTRWATEVDLGPGGSVDFVATRSKTTTPWVIDDFICVELQAAGTTGTPWEAVLAFQRTGVFSGNHDYGINWANEFVKTMMQQVYKKGMVLDSWRKSIVFVLQDVGLEYIRQSCDVSGLHDPAIAGDPIQFFTVRMAWQDATGTWIPIPAATVSADLEGIRKILGGSDPSEYMTLERFVANINRRL